MREVIMNRVSFLGELNSLLVFMDKEDRDRAVRRYERMFDRAGPLREDELIQRLGSPVRPFWKITGS